MNVTFIGLGIMGSRMAANLLKNGVKVTVTNRSQEPVQQLIAQGAIDGGDFVNAVKDADVVFSMLSTPEVVASVFFGTGGVLEAMPNGALWVDCSTVNPSFSGQAHQEATRLGLRFMDAPVSGSLPQAQKAELIFLVGGEAKDLETIRHLMEFMGNKILHVGKHSQGSGFKVLVNSMLAQAMLVFAETLQLGQKMGLDKDFLLDTLPNLAVSAPFTKFKAEMIRKDDYSVQFPLEWMQIGRAHV